MGEGSHVKRVKKTLLQGNKEYLEDPEEEYLSEMIYWRVQKLEYFRDLFGFWYYTKYVDVKEQRVKI